MNHLRKAIFYAFWFTLNNVCVVKSHENLMVTQTEDTIETPDQIEELMRMSINAFYMKATTIKDTSYTLDDTERIYDEMASIAEDIVEVLNTNKESAADAFIKLKGLQKVVGPNLSNFHLDLRRQILLILKALFEVAPESTLSGIPVVLVDKIVEVFENDPNLGIKSLAVDIMQHWLPKKPKVQARLMKVKGLEPFYHQIPKLDVTLISSLLDLLNKILKEHLEIRNDDRNANRKLYNMIGLIEKISSPSICHGLLEFFDGVADVEDAEVIIPVLELIKNLKPMCLVHSIGKYKAVDVFENLLKYVANLDDKDEFGMSKGLNMTEMELLLNEFIESFKKSSRDEL